MLINMCCYLMSWELFSVEMNCERKLSVTSRMFAHQLGGEWGRVNDWFSVCLWRAPAWRESTVWVLCAPTNWVLTFGVFKNWIGFFFASVKVCRYWTIYKQNNLSVNVWNNQGMVMHRGMSWPVVCMLRHFHRALKHARYLKLSAGEGGILSSVCSGYCQTELAAARSL